MFFNYDLFEIGAIAFLVSGIFIYFFSSVPLTNESLINTPNTVESSSVIGSNQYVEAGVQAANINVAGAADAGVQAANTYANTGIQTSARIWLESIRNWINELISSPSQGGQYVDVGVQTNTISTWQTVKQWFLEVCSIRSSQLSSLGENKVTKWINNLDSIQSVTLQDSESPLDNTSVVSESGLQELVVGAATQMIVHLK